MSIKISTFLIAVAATASLAFTGCKKEFLDEPKPSSSVASTDVFATDFGVRSYLSGIYRALRTQYGSSTDVWGIASVNLAREAKGLDIALNGNWYNFDYNHDNREPNYRRVNFTWTYFYDFVNQANNLIAGVEGSNLSPASKSAFIAEGKAIRAWCNFELVREFAHAYSENPNGPGIPLYTKPTTVETTGNPRSKISDVYKLILEDLTFAVANIPTTRPSDPSAGAMKDVINKTVVNGLLARVYLEMGDYANARDAAIAARSGYSLNAADYNSAFNSMSKSEVMWAFPQSSDQTIYYGTPSAFYGGSGGGVGYFNFFVDSNFVNRFSATDVRAKFFSKTTATDFRKWRTNKFGTTTSFTDHIMMMRVPEMYLIEAEAKARLGDEDGARTALYAVQKSRDASAVAPTSTGAALISEILLERRKELYGEIGVGFLDIKRLGLPLVRDNGHPTTSRLNIAANANTFTLKIPQAEMDANKSLTAADQNL